MLRFCPWRGNTQNFTTFSKVDDPMFVSGFTFIRQAIRFDYPIVEAIESILPLCDEVIVAVGKGADGTRQLVESMNSPKVKIVDTVWDETLREGGRVLAAETDKAFAAISPDADWAVYIQGDEVMHERDHMAVRQAMQRHLHDEEVDGFLFPYRHFYGSYDFVGASDRWYGHEVRVVRAEPSIRSFRDAQGFRIRANELLRVVELDAHIHHYGWVKPPKVMQDKQIQFNKLWHDDHWVQSHLVGPDAFVYEDHIRSLNRFEGSHPKVMEPRVAAMNWHFNFDPSLNTWTLKERLKAQLKRIGINPNYANYKRLQRPSSCP